MAWNAERNNKIGKTKGNIRFFSRLYHTIFPHQRFILFFWDCHTNFNQINYIFTGLTLAYPHFQRRWIKYDTKKKRNGFETLIQFTASYNTMHKTQSKTSAIYKDVSFTRNLYIIVSRCGKCQQLFLVCNSIPLKAGFLIHFFLVTANGTKKNSQSFSLLLMNAKEKMRTWSNSLFTLEVHHEIRAGKMKLIANRMVEWKWKKWRKKSKKHNCKLCIHAVPHPTDNVPPA